MARTGVWRGYALGWIENEYASDMSKSELANAMAWMLESAYLQGEQKGAQAVIERVQAAIKQDIKT